MIEAKINDDVIEVRFKGFLVPKIFNIYVNKMKTIPGKKLKKESGETYWTIPAREKDTLSELFKDDGIEWSEVPPAVRHSKYISEDIAYIDELLLTPYPFQALGINFLCNKERCLLADEMGLGKAQPLDAKILTSNGWIRMRDAKVGTEITNSTGGTSRITGVYPQGVKDIYRVNFSDGSSTECCEEHLWSVNTTSRRYRKNPYLVKELKDFKDDLQFRNGNNKYYIPIVKPVKGSLETSLPIDPWLLGITIGNGSISGSSYGISTIEPYILEQLTNLIGNEHYLRYDNNNTVYISSFDGGVGSNKHLNNIRNLKLLGCNAYNKFIPDIYKTAPLESRIALLQGLMDTDGSVNCSNNHLEYTTVSQTLAKDIQELVWSLGGICKIYLKKTSWTYKDEKKNGEAYRLSIVLPNEILPFRLPRKAQAYRPRSKYHPHRAITSVEYVGKKEAQCIMVDAEDHLYITDDYILTHNTSMAIGAIYKLYRLGRIKKALIVCPSTLKYQWANEIEKFIDLKRFDIEYAIIDGLPKKRTSLYEEINNKEVLFTVINYELLINDIPTLSKMNWDVVVLDEAHRIKNWASKTSEAIMKLKKAKYKWAMTGTPVQNRPDEAFNIFKFIDENILGSWWKFRNAHMVIGTKFNQPNMILGYKHLPELHKKIAPHMIRRLKKDVAPELPDILVNNYYVEMYPEQASLHEKIRNETIEIIKEVSKFTERDENGNIISQHPKANQTLGMFTMLQEVCDAPELLSMSDSNMAKKYAISKVKSPKLEELVIILKEFLDNYDSSQVPEKYRETGPKAVIFTQFARMQELIVKKLNPIGKCGIINGSMSALDKQRAVVDFKFNPEIRFLVCTDAANYGVNLGEASLLVNFDLPWNPAVWSQRNARIHRLDSEYDSVNIINLIARDGLDERILEVLYDKQEMADTIVENHESEREYLSALTSNMMRKLLKKKKEKD